MRQPRSGYVDYLKELGEDEEQELAMPTAGKRINRLWYWYCTAGGVLLGIATVWGIEAGLIASGILAFYLYEARLISLGKDFLTSNLTTACFRAIRLFDKLQLQVALRLQEIHLLSSYTPINTCELEQFSCRFTQEFILWKGFIDEKSPGLVTGIWENKRVQRLDYLRRRSQALVMSKKTDCLLLFRLWICVTMRCSGLIKLLNELEAGLEYAKEYLNPQVYPSASHQFELGELRKQQGLLLAALKADRDLQSALSLGQFSKAAELFNTLGEGLESCIAQQEINAHYLAEVLAGNQLGSFTVIEDKLVPCASAVSAMVPAAIPEREIVAEVVENRSESEESDTAYVYEGTSLYEEIVENKHQPEARSVRLSQRTMAELKERMQQLPASKVKLVCSDGPQIAVPVLRVEKQEVQVEAMSERTRESARNVLQELLQRKGGTRAPNILES